MTSLKHELIDKLFEQFQHCHFVQFQGKLDFYDPHDHQWSFYFYQGVPVWAAGGRHRVRRFQRLLQQQGSSIQVDTLRLRESDVVGQDWDYQVLKVLYQRQKLQREQVNAIARNCLKEVLFDLFYQGHSFLFSNESHSSSFPFRQVMDADFPVSEPLTLEDFEPLYSQVEQEWQAWWNSDISPCCPDFAPKLQQPEKLQEQFGFLNSQTLTRFMNGHWTLRDLATQANGDLPKLSNWLSPYISKEIVKLVEIPDFPTPSLHCQTAFSSHLDCRNPLIAFVDDASQSHPLVKQTLTSKGYSFMQINDPLLVLPTLLEKKPSLVFVNLLQSKLNSYKICSQLKRISSLADLPVIIVTESDNLVDRLRAKEAGAADCLSKPLNSEKILDLVSKHTRATASSSYVSVAP